MDIIEELGTRSRVAARELAAASTQSKNRALMAISKALIAHTDRILEQNALDVEAAIRNDMSNSMQDRLMLDSKRVRSMAEALMDIVSLPDPIGMIIDGQTQPNGLIIKKIRVPLGVIGIIYEARPNVTVDAAALCLKAGNAVILRGGKEAIASNRCLVKIMREALASLPKGDSIPEDAIQLLPDISREATLALMKATGYLDVLIPRGGAGLIKSCVENATVPVIETGTGNCHVFVDASADINMAVDIVDNGKTSRPSVCNALETLLVHKAVAKTFLPLVKERLDKHRVEIRGCPITKEILGNEVLPASQDDYATEFLGYILAVKVVNSTEEAIEHIALYSTGHSEVIVTNDLANALAFQQQVDAAAVYINASTRFTDGSEFGYGAEIGISTQKLHVRGPMGLKDLTSSKYLITGNGQIRQ